MLQRASKYVLAFTLVATPTLQAQNAYGQTTSSSIQNDINYCRANHPKDISSVSTLMVYLKSCMNAVNKTGQADIALNAAWAQTYMVRHHHFYQKPFLDNNDYIKQAVLITAYLRKQGYSVTDLEQAIAEIQNNQKNYRPLRSPSGTDTSAEAQCLYTSAADEASFRNWVSQCDTAYNNNKNPILAGQVGYGLAVQSRLFYDKNNISEAQKYFASSKDFENYADSMGWSTPDLKQIVGTLQQALYPGQGAPASTVVQQTKPKSGPSPGQTLAVLAAGALALGLLFKGSSDSTNSGSSSYSDPGEFRREQERADRERARNTRSQQPAGRSYGLYGDCPSPGMGYGC